MIKMCHSVCGDIAFVLAIPFSLSKRRPEIVALGDELQVA